jgi:hypothetical protein
MTELTALELLLADKIEDEDETVVLTRKVYEDTLPPEYTMADVIRLDRHNALYRAAGTKVLGSRALDLLLEDPKREKVETRVDFGSQSSMRNSIRRNHTVGKGDKARQFYGHSTVVVNNGDEPELLKAITDLGEKARDLFSK